MPEEPQERERPRFTPQGRADEDEAEAQEQEAPADTPQARTDEERDEDDED